MQALFAAWSALFKKENYFIFIVMCCDFNEFVHRSVVPGMIFFISN
jgi:hypothetical protein